MPQSILILGATSAIAHAYGRRMAGKGASFVLAGRRSDALEANAADLRARGAGNVTVVVADLGGMDDISTTLTRCLSGGFPDTVLLAYGSLGNQIDAQDDLAQAREIIDTNFTSAALWLLALAKARPVHQPATVIVIGSVAGDRGRASNFIYGAAKGGLDRFVQGLQHANPAGFMRFILVKPGFVDTPMTAGVAGKGGPLWATPDKIAGDIIAAAKNAKPEVYAPWFWWPIMTIIRNLPRFVFNKLKI